MTLKKLCVSAAILLIACGGSSRKLVRGVVEPGDGERLSHIPGPMPDFGPFESYSDALLAACPLILAKPNALAGRQTDPNFKLHWKLSQEYCAWIYYTPAEKYEMSMLAVSTVQDDPRRKKCELPDHVEDARYRSSELGYVFVVHGHPYQYELSDDDIGFIVEQGRIHGFSTRTKAGDVPIGIVAFFSSSKKVSCDGFFLYAPLNGELVKWTPSGEGHWRRQVYGVVQWTGPAEFSIVRK